MIGKQQYFIADDTTLFIKQSMDSDGSGLRLWGWKMYWDGNFRTCVNIPHQELSEITEEEFKSHLFVEKL